MNMKKILLFLTLFTGMILADATIASLRNIL